MNVGGIAALFLLATSGYTPIASPAALRDAPSTEFISIALAATIFNSGHTGRAFLIPTGERTNVRIEASGVPDTVARPIHLYTYIYEGSCVARSKKPAFALTETVLANSVAHPTGIGAFAGPLTVSNTAPISLAALREKPYAIVVKTAPSDGDRDLYCGNVGGR